MSVLCEPIRHTVEGAKGVPLNVWEYPGKGPALILIHCTGGVARMWDPVVTALQGTFRVFAPDTRGQGDSGVLEEKEDYAWRLTGADLLALIDHFALDVPVYAVGHSAGGAQVAYAEDMRPGTFHRPALLDAIIGPRYVFDGNSPLGAIARKRINVFSSRDDARSRYLAKPPMVLWDEEVFNCYMDHAFLDREDGQVELKCPGHKEAWIYESGGACELFEAMDRFQFRPLIVTASESYLVPIAHMQQEGFPGAELRIIEGATHFIPQERPEAVANLLVEWFASHPAP